jgi:signal transduction histidine kinase
MLGAALCVAYAGAEVPLHEVKNVLILLGDDPSLPAVAQYYNAIQATLKASDPSAVNVYVESLDVTRFRGADYPPQVVQWYRQKYRSVRPNVIVTVTLASLTFMLNQRANLWPGVPILAGAITSHQIGGLQLPADVKPVLIDLQYEQTLKLARTLFPRTRHVVAVYGSAPRDKADLRQLQEVEAKTGDRLEWSYLTGLSAAEYKSRLAGLPDQTIVLWSIATADSAGRSFVPAFESVAALAPSSSAPVFGVYATYLGAGMLGGVTLDAPAAGREIAEAARSALGLPPSSTLPFARGGVGPTQLDWNQLRKWGIPENRLPHGSKILFREPSLLEAHRELVISASVAMVILAALVVFLSLERRRLAAAQRELNRQAQELRGLSAALIMAQEEERSRIARELHDDINQRLALLAIETRQLRQQAGAASIAPRLEELSVAVAGLSTDVHSLAYGLHPAKLDLLGLLPAVKRHCQEVERHSGIAVELTGGNLPGDLSRDISLCLYRVVQESLANVVRHSGSQRASVDLRMVDGIVVVTIADNGVGFDPGSAGSSHGLGILSMRERLRLVNGAISIKLLPDAGTEVKATVPVEVARP